MPDEGGLIDRVLQNTILTALRDVYPSSLAGFELKGKGLSGPDQRKFYFNLLYLQEHALCDAKITHVSQGVLGLMEATITAKGIDFLEDDGGLSAILGVLTVKIHAETIRELIAAKIETTASIPADEKSALKKVLASLPGSALQAGTTDLVQAGLNHVPNIVEWLHGLARLM